jgi:hypothetical protein
MTFKVKSLRSAGKARGSDLTQPARPSVAELRARTLRTLQNVADPTQSRTDRLNDARSALDLATSLIIAAEPHELVVITTPIFWRTAAIIRELLGMIHARGTSSEGSWVIAVAASLTPILTMIAAFTAQRSTTASDMSAGLRTVGIAFCRVALILADTSRAASNGDDKERLRVAEQAAKHSGTLFETAASHLRSGAIRR